MNKKELTSLIEVAAGRKKADLVIKNCNIVDVRNGETYPGDIAITDGRIAGTGQYEGVQEIDASGLYAAPGLIDGHIHIESSYVSPEEISRLVVPHGTTTIIADPHEIVNVCGLTGLNYMLKAGEGTPLKIQYMLPSCVPATPFEHSGAVIDAKAMEEPIQSDQILGLGEMMNYPGIIGADSQTLDKVLLAKEHHKPVDGHAPSVTGKDLNAYSCTGIVADHECDTVEGMKERIRNGMYVMLREGSACHNLKELAKGVTPKNAHRCLLCSDDRQPKTILSLGHLDNHLRMLVEEGVDPIDAIRMGTINVAECFSLEDRGSIEPGMKADIMLFDNLHDFNAKKVYIDGELTAQDGQYLKEVVKTDITPVRGSVKLKDFSADKFKMNLSSPHVNVIQIEPGGVVTTKAKADIKLDENGEFIFNPDEDILKVAVVERHQETGNVACGFLKGYGLKEGAIALSIAHDSHNLIVVGVDDE